MFLFALSKYTLSLPRDFPDYFESLTPKLSLMSNLIANKHPDSNNVSSLKVANLAAGYFSHYRGVSCEASFPYIIKIIIRSFYATISGDHSNRYKIYLWNDKQSYKKNLHMMQKWNVILLRWHTLSIERYISMAMPFRKTLLQPRQFEHRMFELRIDNFEWKPCSLNCPCWILSLFRITRIETNFCSS